MPSDIDAEIEKATDKLRSVEAAKKAKAMQERAALRQADKKRRLERLNRQLAASGHVATAAPVQPAADLPAAPTPSGNTAGNPKE